MRKALLKRTADALEKLAVAGLAVGIFQGNENGIYIGAGLMLFSYVLTLLEAKL